MYRSKQIILQQDKMTEQTSIVLSFDIGIHNLAFCCLEKKGTAWKLLSWDNVSILEKPEESASSKQSCVYCKLKPKFIAGIRQVCGKHTPPLLPPLKDDADKPYKSLPTLATLKEILQTKHNTRITGKKEDVYEALAKFYSLPIPPVKKVKASHASMTILHDGLREVVVKHKELWSKCTLICLENQPAFKNPQMKSVQMMLFATLRDILQPNPPAIQLVHAGVKVKGKKKGDEGYKERKLGSEERAEAFLKQDSLLDKGSWCMK
jgi:hypothetical protein